MKRTLCLATATLAAALGTGTSLHAQSTAPTGPTAVVVASSAPNAAGSASFGQWTSNSIQALYLGVSSYGDPNSPTFYQAAPSAMKVSDNIVTGFASWKGVADPGTAFGASFANELGNRLHFGLDLKGNGSRISIDNLSFSAVSTDPWQSLSFGFGIGGYSYSSGYVGIDYGADGIRGTSDDVWVTSGLSSQLVDEIIGRGSGNAWAVYATDPGTTLQNKIDAGADPAAFGNQSFTFTGTYSYAGNKVGSSSVQFNVPDSGSTLVLLVFAMIGLTAGRGVCRRTQRTG